MRVVLLEDVPNVGKAGEVKKVADGFGRNYLLARKLAALATPGELKRTQSLLLAAERRRALTEKETRELGQRLEGMAVTVKAKAGPEGHLYGSVTNADIAQELSNVLNRDIDKRKVELEEPIKELGEREVVVRLLADVTPRVKVTVVEDKEVKA